MESFGHFCLGCKEHEGLFLSVCWGLGFRVVSEPKS